jgi:hypothetical protein
MANAEYDTVRIFASEPALHMKGSTGATPAAQKMLADLAAAHRETMRLSGRKVKVARIRITHAGRGLEGDTYRVHLA